MRAHMRRTINTPQPERITAAQQVHGTRLSAGRVRLGCKVGMPGCERSLMLRLSPAGGWRPSMRRFEYEHGGGTPATQVGHQSSAGCPPDSLAALIASPAPSVLRAAPAADPAASETAPPASSTAPCRRERMAINSGLQYKAGCNLLSAAPSSLHAQTFAAPAAPTLPALPAPEAASLSAATGSSP